MPAGDYKNPPIEEAVCEFSFGDTGGPGELDLLLPGKLQSHPLMKDVYTGAARPQNLQQLVANVGQQTISVQPGLFRVQLPTSDGKSLVSVGPNIIGVSVLKPYESWENFRPRIKNVWDAYISLVPAKELKRIGVRYINRIIVPDAQAHPSDYLSEIEKEHPALKRSVSAFVWRDEYVAGPNTKLIVTQATLKPTNPSQIEFLIDIDAAWEGKSEVNEKSFDAVDALHKLAVEAFEAFITDKARAMFDA